MDQNLDKSRRNDHWSVGVSVKVPIFSNGQKFNAARAARFDYKSATMELLKAKKEAIEHAKKMWKQLESVKLQRSARAKEVEFARKSLNGIREGLNSGVYTVVQVLEQEEKYREAELALNKAKQDEQSLIFRMLALLGKLNHFTLGIATIHK